MYVPFRDSIPLVWLKLLYVSFQYSTNYIYIALILLLKLI